ncbi:unnamed protein product [Allacma fusca]|uniref:Notch ligand N-terminal domain-containing protein n=1 Tax=Allacma fusca TaxID=39272 RepID=A0A8J2L6B7_9HEXA|nr:unnamed protein product [Allacma fusca]
MRWNDVATALLHLWWILILHSLSVEGVGGIFELKLKSFSNPFGVDDSSVCCNNTVWNSGVGADKRDKINSGLISSTTSECICSKIKFRICVKHYQVSVDPEPPCYIGETVTNEAYDGNQIQLGSIFSYEFNFRWPGTFSLIIEAWQQQELNQQQHNQQLEERRRNGSQRLITRMAIQQFLDVGTEWRDRVWSGRNNQTFNFDYRVRRRGPVS